MATRPGHGPRRVARRRLDNGMLLRPRNQTKEGVGCSRFGVGANGRLLFGVVEDRSTAECPIWIFRAHRRRQLQVARAVSADATGSTFWADENGGRTNPANEVIARTQHYFFGGWYVTMTPDLTMYASNGRAARCDALSIKVRLHRVRRAEYDLTNVASMPGGTDSARPMAGAYCGWRRRTMVGSTASTSPPGKTLWTYRTHTSGVHGSHNATAATSRFDRRPYRCCRHG